MDYSLALFSLGIFLVGYVLGRFEKGIVERVSDFTYYAPKKKFNDQWPFTHKPSEKKIGAVSSPTAKEIYYREHPEEKEEIEEMNRIFGELPKQ